MLTAATGTGVFVCGARVRVGTTFVEVGVAVGVTVGVAVDVGVEVDVVVDVGVEVEVLFFVGITVAIEVLVGAGVADMKTTGVGVDVQAATPVINTALTRATIFLAGMIPLHAAEI